MSRILPRSIMYGAIFTCLPIHPKYSTAVTKFVSSVLWFLPCHFILYYSTFTPVDLLSLSHSKVVLVSPSSAFSCFCKTAYLVLSLFLSSSHGLSVPVSQPYYLDLFSYNFLCPVRCLSHPFSVMSKSPSSTLLLSLHFFSTCSRSHSSVSQLVSHDIFVHHYLIILNVSRLS